MSEQIQLGLGGRREELDAKVLAALRSEVLDEKDKEILRVISSHRGAAQAIRAGAIAEEAGLLPGEGSRRKITLAIELFVNFFKLPIGGLREKPFGYFLIVDAEDLDTALRPLRGELTALLRRMRALASKERVAEMCGQASLDLDREDKEAA